MATRLEELTGELIAQRLITSTTGSLSDRAKRRMEKNAEEAYKILKKRKSKVAHFRRSGTQIGLRWSDDQAAWARNINLAIEEFKQEHPKMGKKLQGVIDRHREVRRAYVEFEGEVPDEFYVNVIMDVMEDTTRRDAEQIYRAVLRMEKGLERERGPGYIIRPE